MDLIKRLWPHAAAFLGFMLLMFLYFSPVFQGKTLQKTDVIEFMGIQHESHEYKQKGEDIHWTGSSFSGMPLQHDSNKNIFGLIHQGLSKLLPLPVLLLSLAFLGFYILLSVFKAKPWIAFAGASAYALSSFTMISILAGHINKVYDMVYMAPVLAGIILVYKGKIWRGMSLTVFFLGMEIYYRHIQINYYLMFMILLYAGFEAYRSFKNKKTKTFVMRSALLAFAASVAIGANIVGLWATAEYAPSSTRGGTELTKTGEPAGKKTGGLDKDYAFAWSLGKMETMSLFIPYFNGGGSHEHADANSHLYKALIGRGANAQQAQGILQQLPLYWGEQPFTVGPTYMGAIIILLFVWGLFTVRGPIKWWALGLTVFSIVLAWGRHFEQINDLFFYYLPLYNKFRTVTMALTICMITLPFLGFYALIQSLNGKIKKEEALQGLKWAFGICAGLTLIFLAFAGSFMEFSNAREAAAQIPAWMLDALKEDRQSYLRTDALRTLVFLVLAAGLLWAVLKEKVKASHFAIALSMLIIADMWPVNKRYLNDSNFQKKRRINKNYFQKTPADIEILADSTKHFRVFDLNNPFNNGRTSYHHKSIGGYSAIKLQRYQEIIDRYLSKSHIQVLNMLNTRYFIVHDPKTNRTEAKLNAGAAGAAWFVKELKIVQNANEEINALKNFDPKTTAYMDVRFENLLPQKGNLNFTGSGQIELKNYHPEEMTYYTKSAEEQFAVFSEIYYQPGWQAYLDGVPVPHGRVDYVLRGMLLPAGEHQIVFKYAPNAYRIGDWVALLSSILIILTLGGTIFFSYRK
ncbi:MAG: YfhO family protein [Cytophagales bacterium]|nr:YfhO family protein [Cytophagales bacterium]